MTFDLNTFEVCQDEYHLMNIVGMICCKLIAKDKWASIWCTLWLKMVYYWITVWKSNVFSYIREKRSRIRAWQCSKFYMLKGRCLSELVDNIYA